MPGFSLGGTRLKSGVHILLLTSYFLLLAFPAYAATRYSVNHFHPSIDGGEYFTVGGTKGLYQLQWHAGTYFSYAYKVLDESATRSFVDRLITQHFVGGIGITDWLAFGLEVPLAWNNHFADPDVANSPLQNKLDLGDPRFEFKLRVLDRYKHRIGLALAPFVTAPLGKEAHFMGEDSVTGGARLMVDTELAKRLWLALNLGVEAREKVNWRSVDTNNAMFLLGGGAALKLVDGLKVVVEGFLRTPTNKFFKDNVTTPAEVLGGLKWDIGKTGFQVAAGGGGGPLYGSGSPQIRGFAGVSYTRRTDEMRAKDQEKIAKRYKTKPAKDYSAIVELREKCPADPASFDPKIHDEGCPKYYELREAATLVGICPKKAEDFDPKKHDERCPKVYTLKDTLSAMELTSVYAMSTVELAEGCPPDPSQFKPKVHSPSCPKYYELKEMIATLPNCPPMAEQFDPKVHDEACPKVFTLRDTYKKEDWAAITKLSKEDTDKDRIPDALDRCPREPGPAPFGCPFKQIGIEELVAGVKIMFGFGSHALTDDAATTLANAAELLKYYPIFNVRIEGYADDFGKHDANMAFSGRRANVVKDYLIRCGVDPTRLRTVWYGEGKRLAQETAARNRGVIFVIERQ